MYQFEISDAATIVQTALTPVFLLTATAGCLNVFATRLARVSDRVNSLFESIEDPDDEHLLHLLFLRKRTLALEAAVLLATASGVSTCLATLGFMVGAMRQVYREQILLWFFGLAVATLIGALLAFLYEMSLAGRSMLQQIASDTLVLERRRASKERD
ncbi:hypothetical protein J2Y48_000837 [Mycoplana sp. BE70]|uniref:DUF2721 domain-containing protein n=1 Tax=Mycoplana sp. BE70 TaxID=2817775 RepID=UPI002863DA4C|nr:DUF2721 domain-containing protein [Mycoplana sp. BE70]MDR6755552.1 hypothetical protein [Mycoplana sp. BE70]